MAQGAFTLAYITEDNKPDGRNIKIDFKIKAGPEPTPPDQETLMLDIERVIVTLNALFPAGGKRFEHYYNEAFYLASAGLVGPSAQPHTAARALENLKDEILLNEGGNVKNRHLIDLGTWALVYAGGTVLLGIAAHTFRLLDWLPYVNLGLIGQFCYAVAGAMAGTWVSFGWRKAQFRFEDLGRPEADYLWSSIRLIFTGLQTIIIGLLLTLGIVSVSFGQITTAAFAQSVEMAVLIGLFCGFSEQTLPSAIAKQASSLLQKVEGSKTAG